MIHGLDLFSGIGGITKALAPWVRPIAYCEQDRYAQGVLLSRMAEGLLPYAPIWEDVKTLTAGELGGLCRDIGIIYGGFPCQDISTAGAGAGLGGERSGLFFEIIRLTCGIRPRFVFLENVPAITVRGLDRVLLEFNALGYDCRWTIVSAAQFGAPHLRERWFLLASDTNSIRFRNERKWDQEGKAKTNSFSFDDGSSPTLADTHSSRKLQSTATGNIIWDWPGDSCEEMADSDGVGVESRGQQGIKGSKHSESNCDSECFGGHQWWATEPALGRVAHGIPHRVDRVKGLGNAVVPLQAREAFKRLMGLK